jgi:hypothetical protein
MLVDVYQLCYPENNGVYDQRGILRCPVSVAWEPFLPHPHRKLTVRCRLAQPFYVHEWVAGVSWGRTTCNCSGRRRYHKAQVRGRIQRWTGVAYPLSTVVSSRATHTLTARLSGISSQYA